MKLEKIFITILCAALFAGCAGDSPEPPGPGPEEPSLVKLSGDGSRLSIGTRAPGIFPNNGSIGVVAAKYNTGSPDWTDGLWIDNVGATANTTDNVNFTFDWSADQYWPLDDSELVFLAYSPYTNAATGPVVLDENRTTLNLVLQDNMPEVLYASNNADETPRKKSDAAPVALGEFRHALSQVTVRVITDAVAGANSNIKVTSMQFVTWRDATMNLLDPMGTIRPYRDIAYTYDLVTADTPVTSASDLEHTVMAYPNTQDGSRVLITLEDGPYTFSYDFDVNPYFENDDDSGDDIIFRQGENAVLTILISGTSVSQPDVNITLKGSLTDWYEKPDFGVIIN